MFFMLFLKIWFLFYFWSWSFWLIWLFLLLRVYLRLLLIFCLSSLLWWANSRLFFFALRNYHWFIVFILCWLNLLSISEKALYKLKISHFSSKRFLKRLIQRIHWWKQRKLILRQEIERSCCLKVWNSNHRFYSVISSFRWFKFWLWFEHDFSVEF